MKKRVSQPEAGNRSTFSVPLDIKVDRASCVDMLRAEYDKASRAYFRQQRKADLVQLRILSLLRKSSSFTPEIQVEVAKANANAQETNDVGVQLTEAQQRYAENRTALDDEIEERIRSLPWSDK